MKKSKSDFIGSVMAWILGIILVSVIVWALVGTAQEASRRSKNHSSFQG